MNEKPLRQNSIFIYNKLFDLSTSLKVLKSVFFIFSNI